MRCEPAKGQAVVILAIDPGPTKSAWVSYGCEAGDVFACGIDDNEQFVYERNHTEDHLVIETVKNMGMVVGQEVFTTCIWIGRFIQGLPAPYNRLVNHTLLHRQEIKLHLCGNSRAKDAGVRSVLLDRYGGKEKAIGKKASQGPLYGVKTHIWSALAVAVTWAETCQ